MERRRVLPGLILILLGTYFLLANIMNLGGGAFLVAIGAAFVVSHFLTNRYGLLIPGCILVAIGAFAGLSENGAIFDNDGAWFFVILGFGFLGIYVLGRRWDRWWPLLPGLILSGSGLMVVYARYLPITWQQWSTLARWWPTLLVVLGIWLMLRYSVPQPARRAIGAALAIVMISSLALLGVSAGVIAAGGTDFSFGPGMGASYSDRVQQEIPAPAEGQVVITNDIGRIVVHPTNTSTVRVIATRHVLSPSGEQGQRDLDKVVLQVERQGNEIQISTRLPQEEDRRQFFWFGRGAWVDHEVWMPANLGLRTVTSTGDTLIEGIQGGVEARTSTGRLTMRDVAGSLVAETSTGGLEVSGLVTHDSSLRTSTGGIKLDVSPRSAFVLEAYSSTGSVKVSLPLQGEQKDSNRVSGQFNGGEARLQVQSSTGSVVIEQAR